MRLDQVGQALPLAVALERLGRGPELFLPLGHDPARHDRVHPDAVRAQVAGERPGHAVHGGLRRGVDRHAAGGLPPGVRAHVDDRAFAGAIMPGATAWMAKNMCRRLVAMRSS